MQGKLKPKFKCFKYLSILFYKQKINFFVFISNERRKIMSFILKFLLKSGLIFISFFTILKEIIGKNNLNLK